MTTPDRAASETAAERETLRTAVRELLAGTVTSRARREVIDAAEPYDRALWARLARELGLTGIGIPEEYGGGGGSSLELAVVLEELGAALACVPYFSSIGVAAQAIVAGGDETAMAALLPAIASGTTIATFAFDPSLGCWDGRPATVRAAGGPAGWTVSGSLPLVLDGRAADLLLLVAGTAGGPALFAVDLAGTGVRRSPLTSLDLTRSIASIELDRTPARLAGVPGETAPLRLMSDLAVIALACEQVGGSQRCLDMAVTYARQRVQFGRPIGSFQAVKHLCADMLVLVESARSAAWHAAQIAVSGGDVPTAAGIAGSYCSDAYAQVAADALHVHGGIGFTYEHDAHLYVRRAKTTQLMLGSPDVHRQRLATLRPEEEHP